MRNYERRQLKRKLHRDQVAEATGEASIRLETFKGFALNRATRRHIKRYWNRPSLWVQK